MSQSTCCDCSQPATKGMFCHKHHAIATCVTTIKCKIDKRNLANFVKDLEQCRFVDDLIKHFQPKIRSYAYVLRTVIPRMNKWEVAAMAVNKRVCEILKVEAEKANNAEDAEDPAVLVESMLSDAPQF